MNLLLQHVTRHLVIFLASVGVCGRGVLNCATVRPNERWWNFLSVFTVVEFLLVLESSHLEFQVPKVITCISVSKKALLFVTTLNTVTNTFLFSKFSSNIDTNSVNLVQRVARCPLIYNINPLSRTVIKILIRLEIASPAPNAISERHHRPPLL